MGNQGTGTQPAGKIVAQYSIGQIEAVRNGRTGKTIRINGTIYDWSN